MIQFKNESDRPFFENLHPKLKKIVDFMVWYKYVFFGQDCVVTRIVDHDGSTHDQVAPYRFIDIRSHDMEKKEAEKLRVLVNRIYPYGLNSKGKPTDTIVALDHSATSPGFTSEHFHVQVPRYDHSI